MTKVHRVFFVFIYLFIEYKENPIEKEIILHLIRDWQWSLTISALECFCSRSTFDLYKFLFRVLSNSESETIPVNRVTSRGQSWKKNCVPCSVFHRVDVLHKSLEALYISLYRTLRCHNKSTSQLTLWKATKKYVARDLLLSSWSDRRATSASRSTKKKRQEKKKIRVPHSIIFSTLLAAPLFIQSFSSAIQPIDLLTLRC